ncbi:hypothetical protein O181_086068 [Austropuccinia psidii MF-1]|uniref:Uncharacterized protein n=1 Tax=Austropuccinia psidii MF-1 TaxID=1389203 RepID=A0A9Q3ILZ2_9BASI|nr:hypothetical protein [Austropuccinia psidii MF-1]
MTDTCDAFRQAHKKCLFFVRPFPPYGQRSSYPRPPFEDAFVVNNDESIPKPEWIPVPQTGRWEQFWMISPVPSSIDFFTPSWATIQWSLHSLTGENELTLPTILEPSQPNEPPIPGTSQPSEPHEDASTCQPEPQVAPMKSTEEPFACPATPASIIIINNMHIRSPGDPNRLLPAGAKLP